MDWWLSLGSPWRIVAPMVDMSELPFRLLCRRHGAQLCYTPMLHAQKFIEDPNYRASHLKTCPEDCPLVVQFCANDPDTFAAAAKLAEPHCDAIDLNLGCPQVIAKRGHYGAFLQDEWDLLKDMINTTSRQISIPVTCKIRIHPDKQVTIQYARMLEKAGCKLLVVHSRTREQKGQATGLADWEVTRAVKAALSIPVVSNGNILNFSDVQHCLEYTGADGVMSAEGILRNPALFSGENPPVWQIAEEFLELCHKFPIEEGHVRTHLFRIFSNCLKLYSNLQEELAEANTMTKFESLTQKLKMRLQDLQQAPETSSADIKVISPQCDGNNESDADSDRNLICQSRDMSERPSPVTLTGCENVSDPETQELRTVLFDKHDLQGLEETPGSTNEVMSQKPAENLPRSLEETAGLLGGEHPAQTAYEYHLPVWLCHARPLEKSSGSSGTCKTCNNQATTESGTSGTSGTECVHQMEAQGGTTQSSPALSKNVERKLKRYELTLRGRRMKRKRKKEERKQRKAEEKSQASNTQDLTERLSKLQMKELTNEKCRAAMATGQRICIDLSMDEFMTQKECSKLAQQVGRLYGANKKSPSPAHLYFTGLNKKGHIYTECIRKHQGFQEFMVEMHESSHLDIFESSHIVFLSPDSPNVLTDLDPEKVYIIGGLVDEQVSKHVTLSRAQDAKILTARLPLMEYMERNESGTFNQILAVNQVFEILLKFVETKDWRKALEVGVPKRKGFTLKQTHNTPCSENVEVQTRDREPS